MVTFFGADSLTVTASDGALDSAGATVDLFISAAEGIKPNLVNAFDFNSGDGIAFNPNTGNLFGLETVPISPEPGVFVFQTNVKELTPDGEEVSSFFFSDTIDASGVTFLPNGNLLLLSALTAQVAEYTTSGELVEDGINFSVPGGFVIFEGGITGLTYDAETETLFGSDIFRNQIRQFDLDGNELSQIDLAEVVPGGAPEGIVIDPEFGEFLVGR